MLLRWLQLGTCSTEKTTAGKNVLSVRRSTRYRQFISVPRDRGRLRQQALETHDAMVIGSQRIQGCYVPSV
jgi:hypothetical protein